MADAAIKYHPDVHPQLVQGGLTLHDITGKVRDRKSVV